MMMEQMLFLGRIENPIQLQSCLGKYNYTRSQVICPNYMLENIVITWPWPTTGAHLLASNSQTPGEFRQNETAQKKDDHCMDRSAFKSLLDYQKGFRTQGFRFSLSFGHDLMVLLHRSSTGGATHGCTKISPPSGDDSVL